MTTRLRKVGNSIGLTFSRETIAKAGFHEGQEVQIVAAPGLIAITSELHLELNITAEEANAICEQRWDAPEMQTLRDKVLKKLKSNSTKENL